MKLKGKKLAVLSFLLAAIIISVGLVSSCTRGTAAIGWSGGNVVDNVLYVGSNEGRLVSIDLDDDSVLRAEPLTKPAQGGLLGCNLGCGSGPVTVPIYGTPVVANGLVYAAGYNGKIVAYRTDNFAQRWVYPREGYLQPFVGGLVIFDDKLYIGSQDGRVLALDAETGDLLFSYQTGDRIWGTPSIDESSNTLYIGSYDKKFYALNTTDLTLKWSYETEGSIISTPLINNGTVYFGSFDRSLYAVNTSSGSLKWKFTGGNWFWAKPEILNGVLYAGCLDNFVYVLNPDTGAPAHEPYDLKSQVSSAPAVVDDYIVFCSRKGIVYRIDTSTMEMSQLSDLKTTVDGPLTASDGIVYIHPEVSAIERINVITGAELQPLAL